MSLKIWLPLDGDLHNQGCSNIQATISNGVIDNNGKIGKCYFLGSTSKIYSDLFTPILNNFSLCCWYKANEENTTNGYIFGLSKQSEPSFMLYKNGTGHFRLYINSYSSYAHNLDLTQWHHLTITYNGTEYKLYIDGEYKTQREQTIDYTLNEYRCFLNCRSNNSNTNGAGGVYAGENYYNDFRYYDHCLSAAEVREIAQGLVLHYKLDNIEIKNGTNLVTGVTKGGHTTLLTDGRIGVQTTGENADTYFTINLSENITNGTSYFLSCDASGITSGKFWNFPLGTQSNTSLLFRIHNGHNEIMFTANDINWGTNRLFMDDINREDWANLAQFYNFQLIKIGSAGAELEVKDSSGYGHNGTITGTLTTSSDSPRYDNCSNFNGTERITTSTLGADIRTLSCWCKTTKNKSTSQHMVADSFSNMCISFYNGTIIGVFGTTRGTGSKCTLGSSYKENDWNHIVVVKTDDAGARDIYCNGVKLTPTSNDYWSAATGFFVGARNTSNGNAFYGQISDVRAYVTPLLDTDIKLLYNIGMRVDNLSGVHSFELEETPQNKITKTGILKNNIIESYLTLPDNSYWKLILYHYVDNGNNLFTSSNATDCNDFGLYSKLKYINNYTYNGKYEFYVIQDGKEFRWTQTSQPTASSITGLTVVDGYTDPVRGLAKAKQSNTYIGYGSWWGACGCWTKYSTGGKTGIPGFGPKGAEGICEKYLALYVRIEKNNISFTDGFVEATEFIEI